MVVKTFTKEERVAAAHLARADLYFFARWMFNQARGANWLKAPHHKVICDALMRVFDGQCKRLIINIPPRYSKTELAVVNFIAWAMGQVPDSEFIHLSYSGELAANNSSKVLDLMDREAYKEIFKVTLTKDAAHHWKTSEGGVVYTSGMDGTLTGFGAGKLGRETFGGAIIIDDPHKATEARSDTMRQSVINWYQNTVDSRKNNGEDTPVILIMQRLHEEDLSGWLLNGGDGHEWEHVSLEALMVDADGEEQALWPEKHTVEQLKIMERAAPYVFAGQYQQRPAPMEGGLFKPDQLVPVDAIPAGSIKWVRGWDFGSTIDGDATSGALLGELEDGRYIIADVNAAQRAVDDRDAMLRNTAKEDGHKVHISIPQDPGQAGKTQVLSFTRMLRGYRVHVSPESGDKYTRAEPFAAQVNVGNVMILKADWNKPLKEQLRNFPNTKHKDMVDSLSRAFAFLVGGFKINIAKGDFEELLRDDDADMLRLEAEIDV